MAEKMLIDASHAEETRVVVVRGNRIEEFDFESEHKKQIRGNIYLAKVTRVEPSLQAAFVDYGGNRHGFLAFAEIHPDYYQIPLADRQALLKAEAEEARRDDDIEHVETGTDLGPDSDEETVAATEEAAVEAAETIDVVAEAVEVAPQSEEKPKTKAKRPRRTKKAAAEAAEASAESADGEESSSGEMAAMVDTDSISEETRGRRRNADEDDDDDGHPEEKEVIESVGAEDAMEEVPDRQVRKPRKQYRIQEVIKRRQILLVQVAKEERGNKGAALTTYLSLAGRYSVLMPNTARGGGISRKITNLPDRKRLKEIARALDVPQGMGVILRTAGANRTKVEVKRDFEYLMRLWENVRTLTLSSTAPCLVYEEGSLIKRSIRDLYNKDISEIIVAGEEGYKEAKSFMKMLMPSHAKVVQPYRDVHPIFSRSGIEAQLDRMLVPQVTLKSGGYIIINQTEALVAIDVNTGRYVGKKTAGRLEDTIIKTNLEAAKEIVRQIRLRDLGGIIVCDFIDMEEKKNRQKVFQAVEQELRKDRAPSKALQVSDFGLVIVTRKRVKQSLERVLTEPCPYCSGAGTIKSSATVCYEILSEVKKFGSDLDGPGVLLRVNPDIARALQEEER
ncbi:MAG: ribonuclease E/G, partial [Rhizobium giardinii]